MATGTVKELEEERKRHEAEGLELRREVLALLTRLAARELERCGSGSRDAVLLDMRLRTEGLELLRQALEAAYGKDGAAPAHPGPGRPAPRSRSVAGAAQPRARSSRLALHHRRRAHQAQIPLPVNTMWLRY